MSDFATLFSHSLSSTPARRLFVPSQNTSSFKAQPSYQSLNERLNLSTSNRKIITEKNVYQKLEHSLQKNAKRELDQGAMPEQLKVFVKKQKNIFLIKIAIISLVLSLLLMCFSGVKLELVFYLMLLTLADIILKSGLKFVSEELVILRFCKIIHPILFFLNHYILIKMLTSIDKTSGVNLPLTLLAIAATLNDSYLQLTLALESSRKVQIYKIALEDCAYSTKILSFFELLAEKIRNLIKQIPQSLILNLGMFAIFSTYCMIQLDNNLFTQVFTFQALLASISAFVLMELYLQLVQYIDNAIFDSLKCVTEQTHLMVALLKLNNDEKNRNIQRQCLKALYYELSKDENFLNTETCRSFVYKTYCDIFNQYLRLEIRRISQDTFTLKEKMKANQIVINKNKSIKQDLFIYFNKVTARLHNQYLALMFAKEIQKRWILLLVLQKLLIAQQTTSENHSQKLKTQIVTFFNEVSEKCLEISSAISLHHQTQSTLSKISKYIERIVVRSNQSEEDSTFSTSEKKHLL